MRILIVNAFVRENAGDAALLEVLIEQVNAAFPGGEISITSMEEPSRRPDFLGIVNVGSIRRYTGAEDLPRWRRISRKAIGLLIAASWYRVSPRGFDHLTRFLPREPRQELESIRAADLVVFVGGGHLSGRRDLGGDLNVFFLLLPVVIAQRLGTEVVLAPQSYGPFRTPQQREMIRRCLNRAGLVLVREDLSLELLRATGVRPDVLRRAVDSGFAFHPDLPAHGPGNLAGPGAGRLVGVTVRRWLDPDGQDRYERAIAAVVDRIQARTGFRVILIPQVTSSYRDDDDRTVGRRVAAHCRGEQPILLEQAGDHRQIKAAYNQLDFLIGTRFHSVIFSLTSGVPCIAIEYEHKSRGIMRELGLEHWVLAIGDVTEARLGRLFDKLVRERDAYRNQLTKVMPQYVRRANAVTGMLAAAWKSSQT